MSDPGKKTDRTTPSGGGESIGGYLHEIVVRALVDRARGPVVLHDGTQVLHANQSAIRLLKSNGSSSLAGRRLDELWVTDIRRGEGDSSDQQWVRLRTAGSAGMSLRADHVPVFAGPIGTVATFLENPDELVMTVDQLSALTRSQTAGVLSAGLAHEVASLLLPLLTAIQEAKRSVTPLTRNPIREGSDDPIDTILDCLDLASTTSDALVSLIRNYQSFLRPSPSPLVSTDLDLCDPRKDVEQAVRMARPRILPVASLVSRLELGTDLIRARTGVLTQVTLNLLNNATDALMAGRTRAGHIDVRLHSSQGRVLLEVTDDGPGIPVHVMARLFRPHTTTKSGTSLGMGLSICQALVRRAGGEISVSSAKNHGTTFLVSLPAAEPTA